MSIRNTKIGSWIYSKTGKTKIINEAASGGIKAVIFDLGNVLVDFDHTIAAKKISSFCGKKPEEIFNLFFDSSLTNLFEEGKISPEDFFSEIKKTLNLKLGFDEFLPIWNEIFFLTQKNYAVYNLARNLKDRYLTAILSNINILHFDYVKKKFPIFDAFGFIFTSFELGFIKPHPLIYKKALQALKINSPADVFYTDDRPELIEEARKLGIRSAVFKGPEQLRRDLECAGININ